MIRTGEQAPRFTLDDHDGNPTSLDELLADGPVVLFFYPRAGSPGCTKESCTFRDVAGELAESGARAVGVSADPPGRQRSFRDRHQLGMTLLCDPGHRVAALYGIKRPGPLGARRATFTIAADGTVVDVHTSEVDMGGHADAALEALRAAAGHAR